MLFAAGNRIPMPHLGVYDITRQRWRRTLNMKSAHIGRRFAFCTALSIIGIALGCGGAENQGTSSTSSTGGGGGADSGHMCTWDGTGGGVSIPDCSAYRKSCNLVGTLDGQHYDNLFENILTSDPPNTMITQTLDMPLPGSGNLHLEWPRPTAYGEWIDVTGTLLMPLETTPRAVKPGSQVRLKCGALLYQYILIIDGGELNGCSVN
jgi:hypothetical protein